MPLYAANFSGVVLYLSAIPVKVSPDCTTYVFSAKTGVAAAVVSYGAFVDGALSTITGAVVDGTFSEGASVPPFSADLASIIVSVGVPIGWLPQTPVNVYIPLSAGEKLISIVTPGFILWVYSLPSAPILSIRQYPPHSFTDPNADKVTVYVLPPSRE